MVKTIIGIFLLLHGLVHILYFGQSRGLFELRPKMIWPEGSWAFSRLVDRHGISLLGSILCVLTAALFVTGGIALLASQTWWDPLVAGAAVLSSVVFLLFWNGKIKNLDDQGGIGIIINLAFLIYTMIR